MLVVVIAVRCVPVRTVDVVDVIVVRDGVVSTTFAVGVVVNLGGHMRADGVFVVVIIVQVVRVAVVQVVDVPAMLHSHVAANRSVLMIVIGMGQVGCCRHLRFASFLGKNIVTCAYVYAT